MLQTVWIAISLLTLAAALLLRQRRRQSAQAELVRILTRGGRILDLRSPREYEQEHLPGASNVPLLTLLEGKVKIDPRRILVVYGKDAYHSQLGVAALQRQGLCVALDLGSYQEGRALWPAQELARAR